MKTVVKGNADLIFSLLWINVGTCTGQVQPFLLSECMLMIFLSKYSVYNTRVIPFSKCSFTGVSDTPVIHPV